MNGAPFEPEITKEPMTGTEWAHQEQLEMLRLGTTKTIDETDGEPL